MIFAAYATLQSKPPLQHLYHQGGRDYPEGTFHLIHNLIENQATPKIWCPRRAMEILDVVIKEARRRKQLARPKAAPIVLPDAPQPSDRDIAPAPQPQHQTAQPHQQTPLQGAAAFKPPPLALRQHEPQAAEPQLPAQAT